MARRKRRVIRVVKRTLPKVYTCPSCGIQAVKVQVKDDELATIACGSCGLTYTLERKPGEEPIDLYNRFVDLYMAGQVGG